MFKWNDHHLLEGKHAFLGGSKYQWLSWSDDVLEERFYSQYAVEMGTELHQLASDCIKSKTRLTKDDKHLIDITLYKAGIPGSAYDSNLILDNMIPFVNDAIGYRMSSEVLLYYSPFCFGTTDAIKPPDNRDKVLRISDYKSGTVPAKIEQLLIYDALFCLEYKQNPNVIEHVLRIYQNCQILEHHPSGSDIEKIMGIIVNRNKLIYNYIERNNIPDGKR